MLLVVVSSSLVLLPSSTPRPLNLTSLFRLFSLNSSATPLPRPQRVYATVSQSETQDFQVPIAYILFFSRSLSALLSNREPTSESQSSCSTEMQTLPLDKFSSQTGDPLLSTSADLVSSTKLLVMFRGPRADFLSTPTQESID